MTQDAAGTTISREPELPGEPFDLPADGRGALFAFAALLLFALVAGLLRRARRRRSHALAPPPAAAAPSAVDVTPPLAAHERALHDLAELRAPLLEAGDRSALEARAAEVVEVLRTWLVQGFACPALQRTSAEILAAPDLARRTGESTRAALAAALSRCDAIKFGRDFPGAAERTRLLDEAERCVRGAAGADVHEGAP